MIQAQHLWRYRVRYRRDVSSNRVFRVTVTAPDADRARAYAALADPLFLATVQTPRRMGEVLSGPSCYLCHRMEPIKAGTYQRVDFGTRGIELVCDDCCEKAE